MKVLPEFQNFLAVEKEFSSLDKSKIAIISVPYEHTVSYGGGTAHGPAAIIDASSQVEFYDDEFDKEVVFEQGIVSFDPLALAGKKDKAVLDIIESAVTEMLDKNKFVITLGGEHTISSAPIAAYFKKFPNMSVLHFDAHSDLRDTYDDSKYSHACIMARVVEFLDPKKLTQVGIRAQCKEEAEFIKENGVNTFYASAIRRGLHGSNWQKAVADTLGDEVYISFDVDYFDPSIMPATGTPEPDGFLYNETLDIFREIKKQGKKIIGFDVVELAPMENLHHPNLTTARLIYKLLNFSF